MNRRRIGRGFTLVELLVAMALLSLVMLGLLTAMRSFAQTETRIDSRIRRDADFRVTEQFLRAIIGSIAPRTQAPVAGGGKLIAFEGHAEALRWIGVMPARHGAGGLYRFHLFIRRGNGAAAPELVLQFGPLTNVDSPFEGVAEQSRVMLSSVDSVQFRYLDGAQPDAQWLGEWNRSDRLPRRIALRFRFEGVAWPEIVATVIPAVGPGVAGPGGGFDSGPVIGPF